MSENEQSDLNSDAAARERQRRKDHEDEMDIASVNPYMSVLSRGARKRTPWLARRRSKVAEEIQRNRRGEYKVPTWVLVAGLVAVIAFWAIILIVN